MDSESQNDIVRLAAAANPFQAHIWQHALQQEGIPCQVLGDYLDAGIGDIPGIGAEVWVEAADLARAEAILRHHRNRSEDGSTGAKRVSPYRSQHISQVPRNWREIYDLRGDLWRSY